MIDIYNFVDLTFTWTFSSNVENESSPGWVGQLFRVSS